MGMVDGFLKVCSEFLSKVLDNQQNKMSQMDRQSREHQFCTFVNQSNFL